MPLFSGRFVTLECDGCGSAETSYGRGMTQREFARLALLSGLRRGLLRRRRLKPEPRAVGVIEAARERLKA